MARKRIASQGFTLIEMLVVLVILALIAGLVGPRVLAYVDRARSDTAQIQIQQLDAALKLYALDTGSLPSEEDGLQALLSAPPKTSGWVGPYLDVGALPTDPWGNAYKYSLDRETKRFQILSFGADGALGGSGDDADVSN